jgi:signal transduction histidine kinase
VISVSDTGPGIPEEMRERLFKPFATSKKEGHGIGLALVKRFADNFGGNVSVDSTPGKGATFVLRLPLMAAAKARRLDEVGDSCVQEAIT